MILVVDDDSQVRAAIRRALEELGYPVHEAGDGASAVALVKAERPGLVVLDYVMPGMDGAAVARAIAEVDPNIPILFSTGHAALRALRNAAGEEVPVLEKPFTLDELDELVRDRLAEARRVRTA